MLQFRGDWPWLSGTLGLVSHASVQFCFKCGTKKEDPWTDPSPHAAWRRTLVDHDEFMRNVAVRGGFLSVIWQIPGFLFDYVQMDFMHMGDLGVAQDCAGNVLFEIFERLGGVASRPQATIARMKHYMQDAATDLGVELPLTKLQYTAFMNEGMPRLRMKAAVTRHAPPSPCAPQDGRDPYPTERRPRPPSLPVPAMSLPHVRGILQLVGEAIAAKGAGTIPQALRTLHVACAGSVGS